MTIGSIKGVALINTVAFPVATQKFTRFTDSWQFACYAMVPLGSQSGTSIKTMPHVSHLASKKMQVLLTRAALCAIRHDTNIGHCYLRKKAEGKQERLIVNSVRNRLIRCILQSLEVEIFIKRCMNIDLFYGK